MVQIIEHQLIGYSVQLVNGGGVMSLFAVPFLFPLEVPFLNQIQKQPFLALEMIIDIPFAPVASTISSIDVDL